MTVWGAKPRTMVRCTGRGSCVRLARWVDCFPACVSARLGGGASEARRAGWMGVQDSAFAHTMLSASAAQARVTPPVESRLSHLSRRIPLNPGESRQEFCRLVSPRRGEGAGGAGVYGVGGKGATIAIG